MLTNSQIDQFNTKGYLVLENVLDPSILARVEAEYSELMDRLYAIWQAEGRVGPPETDDLWGKLLTAYRAGCDWFQPMDISLPGSEIEADSPFHIGPAVFDMVTATGILDVVESLIGSEISSNPIQHVRIKPPAAALQSDEVRAQLTYTDWHQDRAVALEEADATEMVTVWLAINDATVDNGCLQVMPMVPDQTMLPHCPKTQAGIADGFLDDAGAVSLPVSAGGAVLFHPLTPHGSLVNQTDGFRWSFDLRYHVTGQDSGRTKFPEFVARSRSQPETELHDWQAWKAMWETARTGLAGSPHIDFHRWSADAPYCA